VFRTLLPKRLKELSKVPGPRQPKKVKPKLTGVVLYGLLSFVLQMGSRREANRELSRPAFLAALQALFPELESLPHAGPLHRLWQATEVRAWEETQVELRRGWIRKKTRLGRLVILQADRAYAYQAGINTSSTSSQDLPSAKYRLHSSSRERNASR
jgi:hypothetical protein